MSEPPDGVLRIRSRLVRIVGGLWVAAGVVWGLGGLALLQGDGRLPADLIVVPVLVVAGLVIGRTRLDIDPDGVVVVEGWWTTRILWETVEVVDVDLHGRWNAPVALHLRNREDPVRLQASWGLTMHQRAELLGALEEHADAHGFDIRAHGPTASPDPDPGRTP